MSIYFYIQCNTAAEFDALESEGAPQMNLSNSNGWTFQKDILGIEPDYCGQLDPQSIIDDQEIILNRAKDKDLTDWTHDLYWYKRTTALIEIAVAARGLGRDIVFS